MWKAIYDFSLSNYIKSTDVVVDIAAGKCELINIITCRKKIAIDINSDVKLYANKDVQVLNASALDIPKSFEKSADVVILSHFLEHLNSKDEVVAVIRRVYSILKTGGKILILQPNIDLVKEAYWDFIDHKVALNTKSILELLDVTDFKLLKLIVRYLPYSSKSNLPISRFLIYIYLKLPEFIRPFAGQTLVIATK